LDPINAKPIFFSMAELQRPSIPSVVDGLTPDQRKIMFCLLKSKADKEVKVSKLSAHVSEHTACHRHDEQRLATAIIRMTHSFVGSNNINLLHPGGQIGTRIFGGEDLCIATKLLPITCSIFPKDDDALLDYLNEDGKLIEPTWCVPILPMILVNGGEETGTRCSTYIQNYNPRDIIANLRQLLNDEYTRPMHPWYRGFKGSIEKTNAEAGGDTYTVTGVIEAVDSTRLRITELPIRCWTMDYRDFLESLAPDAKNGRRSFIEEFMMNGYNEDIDFEVILSEENMNIATKQGLENKFKLTSTIGTANMHLLDSDGNVQKYDTPE
uniref:DNA topoisomerase (ATP-hydrolyzing) n=1 Tax=Setaria italica TaxID=4555 RepID=K3YZF3_SETIT